MRLQKFLALQTTNSRRKAEELILSGIVAVNGQLAKIGTCIDPTVDVVAIDGIKISNKSIVCHESPIVLIMNKPAGYVCSHYDMRNPDTIFDLIPKEFRKKKLMFCGRLDKKTEGMLIITNDGNLAQKLTHPSYGTKKHYEAIISRQPNGTIIRQMLHGITDDGEFLKFDKVISIGRGTMRNFIFEIVLVQGKKNEIHRMFEHFGIFVKTLKRTQIGKLALKGVSLGRCRRLSEKETAMLFGERLAAKNQTEQTTKQLYRINSPIGY